MVRRLALAGGAFLMFCGLAAPAHAELKLCNATESRIGVAVGYKDKDGWATEGWWTVEPKTGDKKTCVTLMKGDLIARYYYIFAIDYTKGGSWGGKSMMCVRDKVFTIRGIQDCEGRSYTKTGFFEVDTGEDSDWTVELSGNKTTQGQ